MISGGFVELDWDHGCESTYGMTSLRVDVGLRLPYAP